MNNGNRPKQLTQETETQPKPFVSMLWEAGGWTTPGRNRTPNPGWVNRARKTTKLNTAAQSRRACHSTLKPNRWEEFLFLPPRQHRFIPPATQQDRNDTSAASTRHFNSIPPATQQHRNGPSTAYRPRLNSITATPQQYYLNGLSTASRRLLEATASQRHLDSFSTAFPQHAASDAT